MPAPCPPGLLQMQLILHYDETYREVKYGNMGLPDIDSKMLMGINVTPIAALLYTPVLIRCAGHRPYWGWAAHTPTLKGCKSYWTPGSPAALVFLGAGETPCLTWRGEREGVKPRFGEETRALTQDTVGFKQERFALAPSLSLPAPHVPSFLRPALWPGATMSL